MTFPESGALDALAAAAADSAHRLRAAQSLLRDRAAAMTWRSPAARAGQHALTGVLHRLLAASTRLDELSAAARAHRRRLDLLATEAAVVTGALRSAADLLGRAGRR